MALTPNQNTRYARQILLPEVGGSGQAKLLSTRVLVIGAGGLGAPLLQYLAAAGIGHLTIADNDTVAVSNLQRQVIYDTVSVGKSKAVCAAERLSALNPDIEITALPEQVNSINVDALLQNHDIIVDCCDNFNSRFTVSDACVRHKRPLVSAAVQNFEGIVAIFDPAQDGPCYRCFNPEPPPRYPERHCEEIGILGAMAGVIGTWQALTVIKYVLGLGGNPVGSMQIFNGLKSTSRTVRIPRDPSCKTCGTQS